MNRDDFCSYCGSEYLLTDSYPRSCVNEDCAKLTWANPAPVSVVLVPVLDGDREGLLVIRRAIEPRAGFLALLGGFVDADETWQAAGAREVLEESDVTVDAAGLTPLSFASSDPVPNRVLLFSVAEPIQADSLPPFEPSDETSERGVIYGPGGLEEVFAFPLHTEAVERFFAARGNSAPHGFEPK